MKIIDLIKIVGGYFINLPYEYEVKDFKIDSREINEGDCFIAINSGYDYIEDAINKKCNCVITDKHINLKTNVGIIKVENSINALGKIARYIRYQYRNIPLIAITGSCGKTTCKELISDILKSKYKVLKAPQNNNNIIGLSNTLLKLSNEYDIVVVEMGMNHLGEISKLSKIARPDLAIITNIGSSHIGNLGSTKKIIEAKKEIMEGMNSGTLILNKYDNNSYKIKVNSNIISNRCLDLDYKDLKIENEKLLFTLIEDDDTYNIKFNIPNSKMCENIIMSLEVCSYFNVDMQDAVNIINKYETKDNRMKVYNYNNYRVIDDTYNASYESVVSNISYLRTIDKLIIVFGDILELGKESKKYHKKLNNKLKKLKKMILTVGEYSKYIKGIHFDSNEEIVEYLKRLDLDGYTIYVKGSHSMDMEYVVKKLLNK